jgi:NADPH:quinone reductase-like Zn-dependent oxidoreductase
MKTIPKEMKAAAFDRFGGPEVLHVAKVPVPKPGPDELLIRVESAGIGVWDPYVREGEFLAKDQFPRVIGSDGAGEVVATGKNVKRFKVGARVYGYATDGGFYAEYATVKEAHAAPLPKKVPLDEGGALAADGITGLRGLEDELHLRAGETLLIYGASGGIGHLAVQLAKRIGAKVFAVASGEDGVELARRLGADEAVDGKHGDVEEAARAFAPDGFDAALILAGGKSRAGALRCLKQGGRLAYPHGVEPEPQAPQGVESHDYDGMPSREAFDELNRLIDRGPFHVELGHVYSLEEAAQAHRDLHQHHLGKLAFRVHA